MFITFNVLSVKLLIRPLNTEVYWENLRGLADSESGELGGREDLEKVEESHVRKAQRHEESLG